LDDDDELDALIILVLFPLDVLAEEDEFKAVDELDDEYEAKYPAEQVNEHFPLANE
jgi:hypothetical protein